jgi:hypothetical protein
MNGMRYNPKLWTEQKEGVSYKRSMFITNPLERGEKKGYAHGE